LLSSSSGSVNDAVEKMFIDYKVDISFGGHIHSYARTLPVKNKQAETDQDKTHYKNPQAPTYVLAGGAGTH
jgi:hypothetical protein